MKPIKYVLLFGWIVMQFGCAAGEKVATEGGKFIGKTTNAVGGITEGGAEAVKGEETPEENPYGR